MAHNHFLLKESLSLVKTNKTEEALNNLDKLIEDEPNNNAAWYLKGITYVKLDDFAEATKAFEKAKDLNHLKKKMDCTEILEQLDILNGAGKFPYNIEVLHLRGRVIEHLRKHKDFLTFFQDHLKLLEEAMEYHENIAEFDLGYRLIWERMSSFLDSLKMENDRMMVSNKNLKEVVNDSLLLHIGGSFDQFSLFDQIIKWFKFLIEEYGIKSACLFNNLGVSLVKRSLVKRIAESNAVSYFQKALTIDKDYSFSLNNLGVCEDSVSIFDDILKIDDINTAVCYNKAFALSMKTFWIDDINLEEFEEALKYCEIVLNKIPEDAECWHLQGLIHESLGNREKALKSYRKSLVITPENDDLLRDLGELLIKMEKFSEAIKILDIATKLEPGDMYFWDYKVDVYRKLKDEEGEFNCYERMLEESPGYTSALLGKSTILIDRGKYNEAVKLLDRVEGGENWDHLWPYAIFQKARTAALQNSENETLTLIREAIRAGAALGDYREDLKLKKLVNKSPEFENYKALEEFKSILAHDFNTKEEKDKFWNKYSLDK